MAYDLTGIDKFWFISNSVCYFLLSYAYYLINKGYAASILMFFTFNMVWEEVFGDPLCNSFTEYLGALIFLILFSINYFYKHYARNTNGISD